MQYNPFLLSSPSASTTTDMDVSDSSSDEEQTHDERMAAFDEWRQATQAWIAAPGRRGAPLSLPVIQPPIMEKPPAAPPSTAADLPHELRANDITRQIINIDSQFRETPDLTSASDFYFRLLTPVRNVLRVRVTSIEFPNNYQFFTALRKFVTVLVVFGATTYTITIPDGNYTAGDMVDALQTALQAVVSPGFTVSFSEVTGRFTITHATTAFSLDTLNTSLSTSWERSFAYGLGFYLGFGRAVHAATAGSGTTWVLTSDFCANFAGDNYVFLKVNDFDCVRQTTEQNDFTALAKVVLREPKNFMTFDDYASQHIKEVVFTAPRDLTRFHVRVLDPFGDPVDLCSSHFSFSLEVLEIQNVSLYNTMRDSIALRYV